MAYDDIGLTRTSRQIVDCQLALMPPSTFFDDDWDGALANLGGDIKWPPPYFQLSPA